MQIESGNSNIYCKNLKTGKVSAVYKSKYVQIFPSVYGNVVVWQQHGSNGKSNIYYRNLLTGKTNIISSTKECSEPLLVITSSGHS
ncbi:MAG: hypothetical protein PHY59_04620 [Methanobacterium sp.]|nr:hypothetical protein [Methanobacterium sp.]